MILNLLAPIAEPEFFCISLFLPGRALVLISEKIPSSEKPMDSSNSSLPSYFGNLPQLRIGKRRLHRHLSLQWVFHRSPNPFVSKVWNGRSHHDFDG